MSILAGRIALITGASQGIGRACALELSRAGASVALAARNLDKLADVASEISATGGTAHTFALDVASEESIKDCTKAVIAHFGAVNILINNAGITRDILARQGHCAGHNRDHIRHADVAWLDDRRASP